MHHIVRVVHVHHECAAVLFYPDMIVLIDYLDQDAIGTGLDTGNCCINDWQIRTQLF